MKNPFKKTKRILALGGGGARGLCNIGVLKVLERHFGRKKMPVDMVIGTSIGSLIGAAYCLGTEIYELEREALQFSWSTILDLGLHHTGLVKGTRFEKIISDMIGDKGFGDMKIPFALTTTDIKTGEELTFTEGNLVRLIRASCAWPGIFSAVKIDGRFLTDGGLRNSIPTKVAHNFGATFVLAVNPGFAVKGEKVNNVIKIVIQTIQIMGEELNSYQAQNADVSITPVLSGIDQFDFDRAAEIINQGEIAAEKKIGELKRKLHFH